LVLSEQPLQPVEAMRPRQTNHRSMGSPRDLSVGRLLYQKKRQLIASTTLDEPGPPPFDPVRRCSISRTGTTTDPMAQNMATIRDALIALLRLTERRKRSAP
jgi:hypothetical protein